MKKFVVFLMVLVFFIQFVGCAGMNINPADLKTPHARVRFIVETYNAAYADHMFYAAKPNLKPEAKELFNAKRQILIQFKDPDFGLVPIAIRWIETGEIITDQMFLSALDKLLLLEEGWYTDHKMAEIGGPEAVAFKLIPGEKNTMEQLDTALKTSSAQASLISDKPEAQFAGLDLVLLELFKMGIHALRVMLQQRSWTEEQLAAGYALSVERFNSLDPNNLKILE